MKLLLALFLVCGAMVSSPFDVKTGTPKQELVKSFPDYHFMFNKTVDGPNGMKMTIGMIGYWENGHGCILHLLNDSVTGKTVFANAKEYKEYITNSKEKKNIVIIQKNFK